jgi:predicted secreted protein
MERRILVVAVFMFSAVCMAFSGDISSFVNLGFSADSKYFMCAQYGIEQSTGKQYAEISLVDVAKNAFVPQGQRKALYETNAEPGQDGSGAFHVLFAEALPDLKKYGIDFLSQGRLVYLLLNGDTPAEQLEFRDFKTGKSYSMKLEKKITISERTKAYESSFSIMGESKDSSGKSARITGGTPDFIRDNVKDYAIRQIFLSPNEKYFICVIEKTIYDKSGDSIKYMIESVKLP